MKKYIIFVILICSFCQSKQSTATESCVYFSFWGPQNTERVNESATDGGFILNDMKRLKCKLCSFEAGANKFSRHVKKAHNLEPVEYYTRYISPIPTCLSQDCSISPRFISICAGFNAYCSLACCYKKGTPRNKKGVINYDDRK